MLAVVLRVLRRGRSFKDDQWPRYGFLKVRHSHQLISRSMQTSLDLDFDSDELDLDDGYALDDDLYSDSGSDSTRI